MSFITSLVAVIVAVVVGVSLPHDSIDKSIGTPFPGNDYQQTETTAQLSQELATGQAHIWYLGHCGWAIKTRTRLLIFDYWEQIPFSGDRTLGNGRIDPTELSQLDVYVFVTHDHGDHYDPIILEWQQEIPNITYVFGWDANLNPEFKSVTEEREAFDFNGMQVPVINHQFDHIPEVAFLVNVDEIVVYHSGDHATVADQPNEVFAGNIDYLGNMQDRVDLAFLSTFGRRGGAVVNSGDIYSVEKLSPRIVFPMHHGGAEDLLLRFADEVGSTVERTEIVAASRLGDHFFYSEGQISGQ